MKHNPKIILGLLVLISSISLFGQSQDEKKIRERLAYLSENPDIAWVEFQNTNIFIGWKRIPEDFSIINRSAAFFSNKVTGSTTVVWSLKASQKGWRPPGKTKPICRTIAYNGKVQASTCK